MMTSPKAGVFQPVDRLVVPVQGTDREYDAQRWAAELAAALSVPIHALHVSRGDEEEVHTDHFDFLSGVCEKWDVELDTRVASRDSVVEEVLDELGPRDLVVIGTRRLSSSNDYHVGSVAGELVQNAPCPVQIVRLDT